MNNCEFKNDNFYTCSCYRCWEKRNGNILYSSDLADEEEEFYNKAPKQEEGFKTPVDTTYFAASQNYKIYNMACFDRVRELVNQPTETDYLNIYGLENDKNALYDQAIKIVFHKRFKNLLKNLKFVLKYNI